MNSFVITANEYLSKNTQAYFHFDYTKYGTEGNPDFINHLKNQFGDTNIATLRNAKNVLKSVLREDLPKIWGRTHKKISTYFVCVIPRAKTENSYQPNQKLFKSTVKEIIEEFDDLYEYSSGFIDGTNFIKRHTNTKTTHMNKSGYGGDGHMPYVGITKATCSITNEVRGKNILLIDDIYTKGVNIDEDVIQAILDKGAKTVIFYSVAKTVKGDLKYVAKNYNLNLLKPYIKETYLLIRKVDNLDEIALERGYTKSTIVNHLVEIAQVLGTDVIKKFQPPNSTIREVKHAVQKIGEINKLKPIYEELNEQISYDDIKLSLVFIN